MPEQPTSPRGPVQVTAEVLSVKPSGEYVVLTLVAGTVAERARPGNFVTLAVGGEASSVLLPRAFWLHRARPTGAYGGTIDVVFAVRGPGTRWLAGLRPHDRVAVTGPLGRPFALPKQPVSCALVGPGHCAAPLFLLAERLRERECDVHLVLAAATQSCLYGVLEARRSVQTVTLSTEDGSAGDKARIADVLPRVLADHHVEVVYGCGRLDSMREVASVSAAAGAWTQLAVEASMACGTGLCSSCLLPVKGADGVTRPIRCCVEGPVVAGDSVDWTLLGPQWT